jgi:integrase
MVMDKAKKTRWLGGTIRYGKKGATYVIDRWIDGVHWHVSTKCKTERAALKEHEAFELAPAQYRKKRQARSSTVEVTPELIADYIAHMRARDLDPPYIESHRVYLGRVMVALAGADLSRMTFIELRDAITASGTPGKLASASARARAVKAFCKWLRREKGLLNRANDPSLDLSVTHATAEKNRRKKAMSIEVVERTIAKMDPDIADVAIVLAATGLHIRELRRLHAGEGGLYEPVEWQKAEGVLLNLSVLHKSGKRHTVALSDQAAVDAARRVVARPDFPTPGRITKHVINVNKLTGEKFSLGWMRHSVATWLALARTSDEAIANQLGHSDTKMARSTYIDLGLAARPVPIPKLKLVKG